ncbi:exopolysaccharide biosynthesis protein, WecB/TagA/CpsF family [Synechococcus sp. PCC 7502]|uniref:WecB/TagA/CpsF family glycosyltransferase n=1 Tax=Synechococcus sp. PCC 7502 TaxID=1173263 RepID=UPI00029FABA2|nr:WecB/TagA/CpsF family glycosyltransferase [Synechococcus sp. PCC 7502]AFY74589.1 exopolysaccharide biosynthesis protein, WecB/TagA/CpsF family [Synechococcus sp. PCC 7502]
MPEFVVLGLPVHISNNYLKCVQEQLRKREGAHVVTINSEMAMQAQSNSELASVIRKAELVIPDGSGVVLFLRSQGIQINRCPGIELSEAVVKFASEQKLPVFLIGGAAEVAKTVVYNWEQKFPDLAIAGIWDGYFSTEQEADLCEQLQASQPRIILVGLGVPRQEFWIRDHRYLCPNAVWIGVGGSFDIWSGRKIRAPQWLRDHHLEWLYRLYKEPWRARRMLALPHFVLAVTSQVIKQAISKLLGRSNAKNPV